MDPALSNSISTTSGISLSILSKTSTGEYAKTTTGDVVSFSDMMNLNSSNVFASIPNNPKFIQSQYDVLNGKYPGTFNELVLIVDKRNQIDVSVLSALGISIDEKYSFESLIGTQVKVIPNDLSFVEFRGVYRQSMDYASQYASKDAITLTVVGIMRVKPEADIYREWSQAIGG